MVSIAPDASADGLDDRFCCLVRVPSFILVHPLADDLVTQVREWYLADHLPPAEVILQVDAL